MAAAVSERTKRTSLGSGLLLNPRAYVLVSRDTLLLQHRAHAQASAVQDSDDGTGRIRRAARSDRLGYACSGRTRAYPKCFLVFGESCGVHVSLHLVSGHVPALPL